MLLIKMFFPQSHKFSSENERLSTLILTYIELWTWRLNCKLKMSNCELECWPLNVARWSGMLHCKIECWIVNLNFGGGIPPISTSVLSMGQITIYECILQAVAWFKHKKSLNNHPSSTKSCKRLHMFQMHSCSSVWLSGSIEKVWMCRKTFQVCLTPAH